MKWTPPNDAVEATPAPTQWQPPADAVVTDAPVPAPGWFQPGSKSEAAVRGFSQAATLGFGDEIQALVRGLTTGRGYSAVRDEERAANAAAAMQNPGSYLAGGVAGALPSVAAAPTVVGKGGARLAQQVATRGGTRVGSLARGAAQTPTVGAAARGGAAVGGVAGLGAGEGDAVSQLQSAGTGALLGGTVAGGGAALGRGMSMVGQGITGTGQRGGALVNMSPAQRKTVEMLGGATLGAGGASALGVDPLAGAVAGGLAGRSLAASFTSKSPTAGTLLKAGQAMKAGGRAGRSLAATNATVMALRNMTGQDATRVVNQANQQVQQAVAQGQPDYAATFQALQAPEVRVAAQKVEEEEDLFDED